jgi:hypothetical protein
MEQELKVATKKVRTPKIAAPKIESVEKKSQKELAQAEPLPMHFGKTPSSFRVGKKLTPLRHDYRLGQMSALDDSFLRDCVGFADSEGRFPRLNADAGRLGRLYALKFVTYDEIGVADRNQIVTLTAKAFDYVKKLNGTPKEESKKNVSAA